eukprot:Partr_v1_DN25582_c0_g1_i1_m20914 putative SAM domain protein
MMTGTSITHQQSPTANSINSSASLSPARGWSPLNSRPSPHLPSSSSSGNTSTATSPPLLGRRSAGSYLGGGDYITGCNNNSRQLSINTNFSSASPILSAGRADLFGADGDDLSFGGGGQSLLGSSLIGGDCVMHHHHPLSPSSSGQRRMNSWITPPPTPPPGQSRSSVAASAKFTSTLASIQQWFHGLSVEESVSALQSILYTFPHPSQMSEVLEDFMLANGGGNGSNIGGISRASTPVHRQPNHAGIIGQQRPFSPSPYSSPNSSSLMLPHSAPCSPVLGHSYTARSSMSSPSMTLASIVASNPSAGDSLDKIHAPRPRPASTIAAVASGNSSSADETTTSADSPPPSRSLSSNSKSEKGRIPESIDITLLNDVAAWLRSLRLHKYTCIFAPEQPNKKKWTWREMVVLTDAELEAMGVSALGARRKLLKVFEMVQQERGL